MIIEEMKQFQVDPHCGNWDLNPSRKFPNTEAISGLPLPDSSANGCQVYDLELASMPVVEVMAFAMSKNGWYVQQLTI